MSRTESAEDGPAESRSSLLWSGGQGDSFGPRRKGNPSLPGPHSSEGRRILCDRRGWSRTGQDALDPELPLSFFMYKYLSAPWSYPLTSAQSCWGQVESILGYASWAVSFHDLGQEPCLKPTASLKKHRPSSVKLSLERKVASPPTTTWVTGGASESKPKGCHLSCGVDSSTPK